MRSSHRSDRSNPHAPTPDSAPRANLRRRGFLLTLGAGGVVTGTAVVVKSMTGASALEPAAETTAAAGKGYAVTEHVQRYYRTMKV